MNQEVDKKLKLKNVKPTAMRKLVLEIFLEKRSAFSLFEIEKQFDKVERTTIFRTLKTFQENCIIHKIDDGTGAVKYALCEEGCACQPHDLHIHFLCNKCKQTHCMKDIPVPNMNLPEGYSFESANFVIKGTCPSCHK